MSNSLQAIETRYKGHLFRSRLEARWAVYFDRCGITWTYEPEGYQLGDVRYLPDFWLPQVSMFAEVKPVELTAAELEKAQRLADASDCAVLRLIGPPEDKSYWASHPSSWRNEDGSFADTDYNVASTYLDEGRFFSSTDGCPTNDPETLRAIEASRAARFGT